MNSKQKRKNGRPRALNAVEVHRVRYLLEHGMSAAKIAAGLRVSKSTVWQAAAGRGTYKTM